MTDRQEMLWMLTFLTDQEIDNFLIENFVFGGKCFYPLHEVISSIPDKDLEIFKEAAFETVFKNFRINFFEI